MKKIYLSLFGVLATMCGFAQISITATGSTTQNFNTLPATGSATWTDNSTISGWYAKRTGTGTTIVADNGGSNGGNLYSYGSTSASDRAIGSLGSGNAAAGHFAWGVQFQNNSGATITSMTVAFTGEQWRNSAAGAQTAAFYYRISSSAITDLSPNVNTGWTAVAALNFTSPVTGGTAGALDGNAAANRTVVSAIAIPSFSLAAGEYVMFKWDDPDQTGSDHGLSVDDVTVAWTVPSASPPTKLAITNVSPASPTANAPFSVTVQSQDATNTPSNVTSNTTVNLTLTTGTGVLGGTLSGVIASGSNSVTISGVTYNIPENGVTIEAGDGVLTPGSATFNVQAAASQLVMVGVPATGFTSTNLASFTVEARLPDNSVATNYTGNISITKVTGSGNITGTFTVAAVAGVATFNALQFDAPDTYTIHATDGTLTSATSGNIVITTATLPNDYFRSVITGNWTSASTWESSPDNVTWIPATITPTSAANLITIQSGDTVTINTVLSADQILINNGGVLINTGTLAFTIEDGAGDDMDIQNGGIFIMSSTAGPLFTGSATVNVGTGGILRLNRSGFTGAGTGVNSNNFVYQHASILDYVTSNVFSTSNVVYFPNVNATTIPIFRTSTNISAGAGNPTTFNGIFECNSIISFTGNGNKIFRNGITGTGNLSGTGTGKFIINGVTAQLGGTGIITTPPAGLDIGTSTTVTLTSAKSVVGNIHLLANGMVQLGNFDLNVLGDITGGSPTSYIRTNGTGMLNMLQIAAAKDFPVGNSTYNPINLNNPTGYDWKVRVEDNLSVSGPFVANVNRAVQRMWTITPSVISPATTSEIFFHYNDGDPAQIGALFNTGAAVQVWHNDGNNWQTAEAPQTAGGTPGSDRTARLAAWSAFSKFAVANDGAVLPITLNYLNGTRQGSSNKLNWKVTCNSTPRVTLELQRGSDGQNFTTVVYSITADAVRCDQPFDHTDAQPLAGMNYYRLKMTDAYGKITYSSILALLNRDKGFDVVGIAPNPVTDGRFKFNVTAAQSSMMDIRITDMSGRMMQTQRVSLIAGFNAVPVDASRLASGTYFIYGIVDGEGNSKPVRFVKQ